MTYEEPDRDNLISTIRSSVVQMLSYFEDPTNIEKRNFVYEREPDYGADDFDGFPVVYLENYAASTETVTINEDVAVVSVTVELVVDAEDEDVESKKHHDELSDEVYRVFKSSQIRNLNEVTFGRPEITGSPRTTVAQADAKPVVRRTFTIEFDAKVKFLD